MPVILWHRAMGIIAADFRLELEYLVTVVDEGSFTRAAELLHVTQPALSHQIRALERTAGGPLLERLPRNVRLSEAPSHGKPVMLHDLRSTGAIAYLELTREVLKHE